MKATTILAMAGAAVWPVAILLLDLELAEAMLALATLCIVPLILGLVDEPDQDGRRFWAWHGARALQPVAALALLVSYTHEPGSVAVAWAAPWFAVTGLVAAYGLRQLWRHGFGRGVELAIDGGCIYLAGGGLWVLISRSGESFPLHELLVRFELDPLTVLLAAVHFHYAGVSLPILAGLAGRVRGSLHHGLVGTILIGYVAIAIGITGVPLLEWIASWALAVAGTIVAAWHMKESFRPGPRLPRHLLGLSGATFGMGMVMAAAYAFSHYWGFEEPSVATMLPWHGAVNALGFVLPALVARTLDPPGSKEAVQAAP